MKFIKFKGNIINLDLLSNIEIIESRHTVNDYKNTSISNISNVINITLHFTNNNMIFITLTPKELQQLENLLLDTKKVAD